jgi:hypothetical protein
VAESFPVPYPLANLALEKYAFAKILKITLQTLCFGEESQKQIKCVPKESPSGDNCYILTGNQNTKYLQAN